VELDGRIRAATLDGPGGHIEYESYNDWLVEQREQRRQQGLWSGSSEMTWEDELRSGQRAPRRWKSHFGIKPPSRFFFDVKDTLLVSFDVTLSPD